MLSPTLPSFLSHTDEIIYSYLFPPCLPIFNYQSYFFRLCSRWRFTCLLHTTSMTSIYLFFGLFVFRFFSILISLIPLSFYQHVRIVSTYCLSVFPARTVILKLFLVRSFLFLSNPVTPHIHHSVLDFATLIFILFFLLCFPTLRTIHHFSLWVLSISVWNIYFISYLSTSNVLNILT